MAVHTLKFYQIKKSIIFSAPSSEILIRNKWCLETFCTKKKLSVFVVNLKFMNQIVCNNFLCNLSKLNTLGNLLYNTNA